MNDYRILRGTVRDSQNLLQKAYFFSPRTKNAIVLGLISIIAIQTLYFVHDFGLNVLVYDDLAFAPIANAVKHGMPFWDVNVFSEYRDQRPVFPNLLLVANVLLASWNVKYQLYLGWFLITISIVPLYLMLRNTDQRLKWISILAAAFLFNTAQYVSLLMDIASRQMVLTSCSIIFSTYFINRVQSHRLWLLPAITCSVIASFSGIAGLSVWAVGVLSLTDFKKVGKSPMLIWIIGAAVAFYAYFAHYTFGVENQRPSISEFFTTGSLKLILSYSSNGLVPAVSRLVSIQMFAGLVMLLIMIIGTAYFIGKRRAGLRPLIPWIQLGWIGIAYAAMTELARANEYAPLSHYITIDLFVQVSAVVIATVIFLNIRTNPSHRFRKAASVVFTIFIVAVVGLLGTSYVVGWFDGYLYHKQMISYLDCMTNPIFDFKCTLTPHEQETLFNGGNTVRDLHLGPFASQAESSMYLTDPLMQENNWKNMKGDLTGLGTIESISGIPTNSSKQIELNRTQGVVDILGWGIVSKNNVPIDTVSKLRDRFGLGEKNPTIDNAYLFIDGIVQNQVHYGQYRKDIAENNSQVTTRNSGWNGVVDLRQLSSGCHDISVRLVIKNHYFEIPTKPLVCIR